MLHSFDWDVDDHAVYAFNDGELAVRIARENPEIAVDIETMGLGVDAYSIKVVSIGTVDISVVLDVTTPHGRAAVRDAISAAGRVLFHNSPYDVPPLVNTGLMALEDVDKVWDTLVSARLAYPGERVSKGLGDACSMYLGAKYKMWKSSLERGFRATTGKTKAQLFRELGPSSPAYIAYAAMDVIMTSRLNEVMPAAIEKRLHHELIEKPGDTERLLLREQTVSRLLLRRMCVGIEIDTDAVDELKAEMRGVTARADAVLASYGVDIDLSREKIKRDAVRVLDEMHLLPASWRRLQNGEPSAAAPLLDKLHHPLSDALKLRSQADRFAADYADSCLDLSARDGRIHPEVKILAATTGRMSVGTPPLQQYPSGVRRMLRFDGPVTSLDWSSIEPVFAANAAGDTAVLAEFEAGGDLYLPVADAAGVPRKTAKVVLLAQLYGQSVGALSVGLGRSEEDTADIVEAVMGRMPQVRSMIRAIRTACNSIGFVQTLSGRVVPIALDPRSGRYQGYLGVNYTIQGGCYDLLSEAIYQMHLQGIGDFLELAVHDELVVSTEVADQVQQIMNTPPPELVELAGRVPVLRTGRADLGEHWTEKS